MADQPHSTELPGTSGILNPDGTNGNTTRRFPAKGEPLIHQVNWEGLKTLYMKEVRRFFKVQTQTIWAPAITTMLFLVIFTVALGRGDRQVLGVNFATFVAPGLIVMGMMQNAFANSSFSFLAGKVQGTIVDYLMPPLTEAELMVAMIGAAVTRAVLVGLALTLAMLLWPGVSLSMAHPWAVVWFGLAGSAFLALLGLLSSVWAEKFDHNAAVTNFVIAPLSLLSGTFYVIDNLAPAFQAISRVNPFFYVISGFRFGFLGQSDIGDTNMAVLHSALGVGVLDAALATVLFFVLRSGWKLKG
ncbi:ABC transporter permease [Novosphingobium resinovorum]|jgi:ABC-2 type transport system permease protein|uniref:Transport permease protein n=1 Tax=Novosphingobium resinovorum TaxID=158500 RepID=A0A031JEL9_9SPHN|nr:MULTISPECIES: ABC transporter permease [Novosphingobium]AOR75321.1 multidrug ABC transporter permease [Novosphingobium resinovorum]EZP71160.1 Antibiotic transport system permease [Novosphingobium resinovorum]MBF7010563.1 ABC transporter permease [Novosphingobium sp. HR1a]WJM28562.1 ABC transporter permease [Novosphingobium resinovorum]